MIKTQFSFAFAGLTGALLSACAASDDRYPSLAVRDAERVQGTLNPSSDGGDRALTITPSGSELTDAILKASTQANDLSIQFDLDEIKVRGLVAASQGSGPDSDARAKALVGIAGLLSLRGQTAITLADLDRIEAEAATQFGQVEDVRAAQYQVTSLLKRQDAVLDSLTATLNK